MEQSKAVLWDVYGTLLALSVGDLEAALEKKETMRKAFRLTAQEFGLSKYLDGDPAETLLQWYVKEIEKTHRRKRAHGVFSPEVKIEDIWLRILKKLAVRGYRLRGKDEKGHLQTALKLAYFFDYVYHAKAFYPGVRQTLEEIGRLGLRQGIISNAQFYTPLILRMLLRREGLRPDDPLQELFDRRLIFFSYRLGVSKPNPRAFETARERLQKMGIEPNHVLYVGNDILNDMIPARNVGFRCILFAGDRETLALRKDNPECAGFKPDAVIKSVPQIMKIIT
jgi:putative hydrolase of the HAD superfamily